MYKFKFFRNFESFFSFKNQFKRDGRVRIRREGVTSYGLKCVWVWKVCPWGVVWREAWGMACGGAGYSWAGVGVWCLAGCMMWGVGVWCLGVVWRAVVGYGAWVWCGVELSWREVVRGSVSVKGYHKKNGTYVLPHTWTQPDGNKWNNKSNR